MLRSIHGYAAPEDDKLPDCATTHAIALARSTHTGRNPSRGRDAAEASRERCDRCLAGYGSRPRRLVVKRERCGCFVARMSEAICGIGAPDIFAHPGYA